MAAGAAPTPPMAPTESPRYLLRIAQHPDPTRIGRVRELCAGERLVLGRGADAFGADGLLDPRMSRSHARLVALREGLQVEDLGSRNGTLVGGRSVGIADLESGDLIGLGQVLIQVSRLPDLAEPAPAPAPLQASSPAMWPLRRALQEARGVVGPRLVVGEAGSGRRTLARALHPLLGRRGPLVELRLAGIVDDALEASLHGEQRDPGSSALARARGGSLLLPDLDLASPAARAMIARLAADPPAEVQLLITATRGAGLPGVQRFDLPPLRARREDILPLARQLASRAAGHSVQLDRLLAMHLDLHAWPGNVAELSEIMRRLVQEQPGAEILEMPGWGLELLGRRALGSETTFDPSLLDPP